MLTIEQELVMGKPHKKYDPKNDQDQSQAQANLQAQLQGQLQGQGQGQGQAQLAVQSLDSKSDNKNENDNKNDNKNSNDNKIDNDVENKLDNKVDNSLDNKVDNSLDNKVENKIENVVDNKVNVDVDVKVDLDLSADGLSSPVIDIHGLSCIEDSLIMPDVVNQTLTGNGNQFNIDQVNNLVDNDTLWHPSVSYNGGGGGESLWHDPSSSGGFSMDAKIEGGESKIDGATMGSAIGDAAGIVSSADASLTQEAFTQTITQGANIQFNSITMQVAGNDLTDSHDTL
jgi:hypothetical protein